MKKTLSTNNTISRIAIAQIKGGASLVNSANNITYQVIGSTDTKESLVHTPSKKVCIASHEPDKG